MKSIIDGHKKMLGSLKKKEFGIGGCNCRKGVRSCPLQGKCLSKGLIYQATVRSEEGEKFYVGQTMRTFKERLSEHKNSFKKRS